jgi:Circularly permutated YpsA SLOG family
MKWASKQNCMHGRREWQLIMDARVKPGHDEPECYPHAMAKLTIISGGQTGVDRAALDAAIARGIAYGGWCPRGGWAEDLPEPPGLLAKYPQLRETPAREPAQRTEWNVRDGDASLILVDAGGTAASGGTALAERLAAQYGKPLLVVDVDTKDAAARVREWLAALLAAHKGEAPFRLAVGGPRESEAKGIYEKARVVLEEVVEKAGAPGA